ncbi:hypothetical protein [Shewanella sp. GXUN23E]|uniref:hypothetical protein n=1 Tax=Shewanella sp. GXUN23E TaxID=3422498 RepID=UPI003D7DCD6E
MLKSIAVGMAVLLLGCFPAAFVQAEIKHISLNKLQFTRGEAVDMRINLVAEPRDINRLEFVLFQASGPEKLMVKQESSYLLRLLGFEPVNDPNAYIGVRVYIIDRWQPLTQLSLFPGGQLPEMADNMLPLSPDEVTLISDSPSGRDNGIVGDPVRSENDPGAQNCTIDYTPGETLWRIGNRYARQWNTHVYGAILALYETNKKAFYRNNINWLKDGASLGCPPPGLWDSFGDKAQARRTFEQLSGAN